ncbi:MAG: hypothetical protein WDM79_15240 [Terricaulis sp.]
MSKLVPKPPAEPGLALATLFGRAQVETALWGSITGAFAKKPSDAFRTRVKHLLEFDRSEPIKAGRRGGFAFAAAVPAGQGNHGAFAPYDALLLYIGLKLLDLGFKRKEVVLCLRNVRRDLRDDLVSILSDHVRILLTEATAEEFEVEPGNRGDRTILLLPRVDEPADYVKDLDGHALLCRSFAQFIDVTRRLSLEKLVVVDISAAFARLPPILLTAPRAQRGVQQERIAHRKPLKIGKK